MEADFRTKKERYSTKVMHRYHVKKISSDGQIGKQLRSYRRKNNFIESVVENYLSTIQNQKSPTKYLKNKGARDNGITPDYYEKCSSYVNNVEDISYTEASYMLHVLTRYYLPLRHDEVVKTVVNVHAQEILFKRT